MADPKNKEAEKESGKTKVYKEIQGKVLDDLVSVNSLFTIAVFIGLSYATPTQSGLETSLECIAGHDIRKRLVLCEVVSFALFLLSSLVAKSLKVNLSIFQENVNFNNDTNVMVVRGLMFVVSVGASIAGVLMLMLSMMDVIQIKLGKFGCGIDQARSAAISLGCIVVLALLFYLPNMCLAVVHCVTL